MGKEISSRQNEYQQDEQESMFRWIKDSKKLHKVQVTPATIIQ